MIKRRNFYKFDVSKNPNCIKLEEQLESKLEDLNSVKEEKALVSYANKLKKNEVKEQKKYFENLKKEANEKTEENNKEISNNEKILKDIKDGIKKDFYADHFEDSIKKLKDHNAFMEYVIWREKLFFKTKKKDLKNSKKDLLEKINLIDDLNNEINEIHQNLESFSCD